MRGINLAGREALLGKGIIMIRRRWFVWAGLLLLTVVTQTCKEETVAPPQPPPPPQPPVLATPASGATGVATNLMLTWNTSTGATSYHLQLATDSTFATTLVNDSALTATSYAVIGLAPSTKYYWRVSATNAAGPSAYSASWSFTTITPTSPPAVPALSTPANGATGVAPNPTLTWNASTGAASYHLQLSTDPMFVTTLVNESALTATSYALSGLAPSTKYYWRVSAANVFGSSAYSGAWSFTTFTSPPAIPVLSTPANGASGVATTPTLVWNPSTWAASYHLQISTDSMFVATLVNESALTATSYVVSGLAPGTKYYWRLSATNVLGSSAYSASWSFTTVVPPPAPVLVGPANGATGVATIPTLTWNASTVPASYYVQVSTDPGFATPVVDQADIVTASFAACLTWNTVYYWRVLAANSAGTSAWSTVWTFGTVLTPTPPPGFSNFFQTLALGDTLLWDFVERHTSYYAYISYDIIGRKRWKVVAIGGSCNRITQIEEVFTGTRYGWTNTDPPQPDSLKIIETHYGNIIEDMNNKINLYQMLGAYDPANGYYPFKRFYPSSVGDTVLVSGGFGSGWTATFVKNVGIVSYETFEHGASTATTRQYHLVH